MPNPFQIISKDYDEKEIISEPEQKEETYYPSTHQDSKNNNTTTWGTKEESNKIRELSSVLYQFSFMLEDVGIISLQA